MDLYPLFGEPITLESQGGITRRHYTATDAAKQISRLWGLSEEGTAATKVSKFESPGKWILMNEEWKARGEIINHYAETVGWVGFRLLVDALAHKCGYRQVEWTDNDKAQWNQRVDQNGGTKNACIFSHPTLDSNPSSDLMVHKIESHGRAQTSNPTNRPFRIPKLLGSQ
jgi:hypothetical protein